MSSVNKILQKYTHETKDEVAQQLDTLLKQNNQQITMAEFLAIAQKFPANDVLLNTAAQVIEETQPLSFVEAQALVLTVQTNPFTAIYSGNDVPAVLRGIHRASFANFLFAKVYLGKELTGPYYAFHKEFVTLDANVQTVIIEKVTKDFNGNNNIQFLVQYYDKQKNADKIADLIITRREYKYPDLFIFKNSIQGAVFEKLYEKIGLTDFLGRYFQTLLNADEQQAAVIYLYSKNEDIKDVIDMFIGDNKDNAVVAFAKQLKVKYPKENLAIVSEAANYFINVPDEFAKLSASEMKQVFQVCDSSTIVNEEKLYQEAVDYSRSWDTCETSKFVAHEVVQFSIRVNIRQLSTLEKLELYNILQPYMQNHANKDKQLYKQISATGTYNSLQILAKEFQPLYQQYKEADKNYAVAQLIKKATADALIKNKGLFKVLSQENLAMGISLKKDSMDTWSAYQTYMNNRSNNNRTLYKEYEQLENEHQIVQSIRKKK
jgi:hypothetical protein